MNGYTHILEEREVSFNEFVWRCARNFGALIHMRDDGLDAKITLPNGFYDSYSQDHVVEFKNDLEKFQNMSLLDAQKIIDKEYDNQQDLANQEIDIKKLLKTRVEKLLLQVHKWKIPTKEHYLLKKFMVDSLHDVITIDCDLEYYNHILMTPKPSPEDWLKEQVKEAEHSLEYHTKHLEDEKVREESVTKWITDLQESVPLP